MKNSIELSERPLGERIRLAESTSDTSVLKTLAQDSKGMSSWAVRKSVAENTNVTPEILLQLSDDEDWRVRRAVAENFKTNSEVFLKLSKDKEWYVREAVAKNAKATIKALSMLSAYSCHTSAPAP